MMPRTYKLKRPDLRTTAAQLALADRQTFDDPEAMRAHVEQRQADPLRQHAARVALPARWRTRDKLTSDEWPALDDLETWRALGQSHALSYTPAACNYNTDTPAARAYCAGYFEIGQAYMQPEQNIAVHQPHPIAVLKDQIQKHKSYFGALLKADAREQARFSAEVVQAVRSNPDLLSTDRDSLLFALGEAAALGLSVNPGLGEAWIIPRNCKEGDDYIYRADFQPGYKGLIKLAYRSGMIDSMFVEVAYKGEVFRRTAGTNPSIEHEPDDEKRTGKSGDVLCAYAVVWLRGSERPIFSTVSAAKLTEIASGVSGYSPWNSGHFEAMAMKTALIRVCKLLPRTDDLRTLHSIVERDLTREGGKEPPRHERVAEAAPPLRVSMASSPQLEPPHSDEAGR